MDALHGSPQLMRAFREIKSQTAREVSNNLNTRNHLYDPDVYVAIWQLLQTRDFGF